MRWEELVEDLEAQLAVQARRDQEELAAEIDRAESAQLRLLERAERGCAVRVALATGAVHDGVVVDVGGNWLVVRGAPRDALIPASAIEWFEGAGRADPGRHRASRGLGLGYVLRWLAEREVEVVVSTRAFDVIGAVHRTGADHVDVVDERGRLVSVPWAAIVSVLL